MLETNQNNNPDPEDQSQTANEEIPRTEPNQIFLHRSDTNVGIHPAKLEAHKKQVANIFEQIRSITENDDTETLSIILSLITKYTFMQTQEQVRLYNEDNTKRPDKEIPKHLDDIAEALTDISQKIIKERILYEKMLKKVKRDHEKREY